MDESIRQGKKLYLVVPCYNEEEIIQLSISRLKEKMNRLVSDGLIHVDSKVVYVNDGSKDQTLHLLHAAAKNDASIAVISFSTNFGHQSAILAGMMYAKEYADMVITIDADLQQDIEALDQFIERYNNGCEIVYGVRNDRNSDGLLKKMTATMYYNLLHFLGCDIITNHADYRLMSKKALYALGDYKEVNLFMRGLVPTLGFQSDVVYFDVKAREAGSSKYTLKKMLKLATDGITSLSIKPLHMIIGLGFFTFAFSILMAIYIFVDWLLGNTIPGYTTSLLVTLILDGITLLSVGIIGEYVGKIYMETKGRPRYIIESIVSQEKADTH